jgi:4'-phosphopantetheinyl transferase
LPQRCVLILFPLLSGEEKTRAERFVYEVARNRFIVSHAATRAILSCYLHQRPEEIRFAAGGQGKPHLVTPAGAPTICFSLSHSENVALCAVTEGRDVGVDVEWLRPVSAWRRIADAYFSEAENQALYSLAGDRAHEAFLRGWTRKEAYSKALGEGISQRWKQFTVSLQPGPVSQVVSAAPKEGAEGPFTLWSLAQASGYIAAVAVEGVGGQLSCWQWSQAGSGSSARDTDLDSVTCQ